MQKWVTPWQIGATSSGKAHSYTPSPNNKLPILHPDGIFCKTGDSQREIQTKLEKHIKFAFLRPTKMCFNLKCVFFWWDSKSYQKMVTLEVLFFLWKKSHHSSFEKKTPTSDVLKTVFFSVQVQPGSFSKWDMKKTLIYIHLLMILGRLVSGDLYVVAFCSRFYISRLKKITSYGDCTFSLLGPVMLMGLAVIPHVDLTLCTRWAFRTMGFPGVKKTIFFRGPCCTNSRNLYSWYKDFLLRVGWPLPSWVTGVITLLISWLINQPPLTYAPKK